MEDKIEKTNKCVTCGGQMAFDVETQSLKCMHCGRLNVFDEKKASADKHVFNIDSIMSGEETEYIEYLCKTCGRKHILKKNETDLRCPSCGDKNLRKVLRIDYKPDGILPFKIDKNKAIKCFFDWIKRRKMSPRDLQSIDRARLLRGLYVPVYNYDFDASSTYSGIGIDYISKDSGESHEKREHFKKIKREKYIDYLESACKVIPSHTLKALEPFSKNYVLYRSEYIYGWIGAEVNKNLQDSYKDMAIYLEEKISQEIKRKLPYSDVEAFKCSTIFSNVRYQYLYYPIYKGSYTYRKKEYTFYINGETGKVIGNFPRSIWKTLGIALGVCLGIAGLALLLILLVK